MIQIVRGNLFQSNCEALVNTVNCVGVMGKGIALEFKKRFPQMYRAYHKACWRGEIKTGHVWIWFDYTDGEEKIIVNFPTKQHWSYPSKIEWIKDGLVSLRQSIEKHEIKSIAIPALGCNNGGLQWNEVKTLILTELAEVDCNIKIYEPLNV